MFKALNPYMLMAMEEIPVADIRVGATPEETVLLIDLKQGRELEHKAWSEVAGVPCYDVRINGKRKGNRSLADIFLEFAQWVESEVSTWKDPIGARPWHPKDGPRQWLSPYLRVANVAELRKALAEDIGMLKKTAALGDENRKKLGL